MQARRTGDWLARSPLFGGARRRLFCFPYAGGNRTIYRSWQAKLGADTEVCPVELPGRGSRFGETPIRSMRQLVDAACTALAPSLKPPYVFFGHSMGALMAFELAREVRRRGLPLPTQLILSGRGPERERDDQLYDLPDRALVAKLREYKGTPDEMLDNPELLELILPIVRADFEVVETYKLTPDTPLDLPIHALGGRGDPYVTEAGLAEWKGQTTGRFEQVMLDGEHFFVHSHEDAVIALVREAIAGVG